MKAQQQQFESVIDSHGQSFMKIAATYEADQKLQQDLHQEILLAIWQALASFKGQSSLKTFVYRVAYNKAFNHVAKHSRGPKHKVLDDVHVCETDGPEQTIQNNNTLANLMMAIRQLPVMQRQLITLALDGISYADIAIITGLSVSNVGVQLNRAKKQLKSIME
jgi:RNA polymerase sigma factor (sigma-70 family)